MDTNSPSKERKHPSWLKVRMPRGENFFELKQLMRDNKLHTVCESASCPNIGECWNRRTATFMLLGNICTRSCGFCDVPTGRPLGVDWDEPKRVADAIKKLGLRHVVITSVNRDELKDGGSSIWAETIHQVRRITPNCTIEVLIPDFKGSEDALMTVLGAKPNILAHNTETVPRLYKTVRPQANYRQSLEVLKRAKTRGFITKTGVMLGLGEEIEEVYQVMTDLRDVDCDILTLGQYLRPSKQHLPIVRYYHPDEFVTLKIKGEAMGFKHVESGPLVRSSYHADEQVSQRPELLEIKL